MPVRWRRKLPSSAKVSNWTNIIPSVYSISCLDSSNQCVTTDVDSKIASFTQYVEGQRLPRGVKGSRALKDTALEVLIQNLSELDNLDNIPKHLTKCLWDILKRRCMLSFHSWKVLSRALCMEEDVTLGLLHYSKAITSPNSPLQVYTKPLISKSFDFITSLSINCPCTVIELVHLAEISNIGILEIINPEPSGKDPSGVRDIVLRAWSREADDKKAFSVLRILRLWNHSDLTGKSLQYLRSFPALALFDVCNCGIKSSDEMVLEAEKLGWVVTHDTNLLGMLEEKCNRKWREMTVDTHLGPQSAERRFPNALWPGSKVQRVERSKCQLFIAQLGTSSKNHPSNDSQHLNCSYVWETTNSSFDIGATKWPDYIKEVAEGDEEWVSLSWDIFCSTRDRQPSESSCVACWTRIGEIRDDRDLILAGVKSIEKQTFVGPYLVSPVPMAYIRLGEVNKSWGVWSIASTKFVLKSLEKPIATQDGLTSSLSRVHSRPASLQLVRGFQLEEASGKRKAGGLGGVRSLKKQRLDDILNDFKTGR